MNDVEHFQKAQILLTTASQALEDYQRGYLMTLAGVHARLAEVARAARVELGQPPDVEKWEAAFRDRASTV